MRVDLRIVLDLMSDHRDRLTRVGWRQIPKPVVGHVRGPHDAAVHADRILDTPPAPTTRRSRNIELDWLRAYAVLLVVSLHLTLLLAPGPRVTFALFHTLNFGAGVDLFFAISGFVIAGSLEPLWALPTFPRGRVPPGFIRDFFIRRFWRLWPASTLWITCCLLAAWACAGRGGWPPVGHVAGDWATVLVPVYELRGLWHPGVLGYNWSLSVEWQFYAIFPFLLVALRSGGARATAFVLLFAFSLYTFEISFMLRFSSIIGGIAVHALHRTGWLTAGSPATPHRWVRLWLTPLLLAVVVTVPQLAHQPLIGQPVRTLLCTLLVAMAAAERRLTADCGLRSLLAWIGLRSYSLYLCHVPVALTLLAALDWLHDNRADRDTGLSLLLIGIAAPIALGLADLSYRHVELPFQRRFRPRHEIT